MSIPVGGNIGLEAHPNIDQFIRIEQGIGLIGIWIIIRSMVLDFGQLY